jgi:hypothetical protein
MAASLTSRLQVHNGCLFAGPHQTALLLWPYGAQLASPASGQPIRVLDASGHVIAQAGLPMDLGGGYVSENPMNTSEPERLIGARIPERCRPTYGYWLVGDTNF